MPKIIKLGRTRGTALIWIDAFVTTLPERANSISYKDVAGVIKRIGKQAEEANVAVVAPWHLNQREGSDVALRMMDSRGFRTAARSILIAAADPQAKGDVLLALDKANGSSLDVPALRFHIDRVGYTVEEIDSRTGKLSSFESSCGVARFLGAELDSSPGRDYVRPMLASSMTREHDPKTWLRELLLERGAMDKDTAVMREEIIAAAGEAGFHPKRVQRAAEGLRVAWTDHVVERKGKPPLRKTKWWLPPSHAPATSTNERPHRLDRQPFE